MRLKTSLFLVKECLRIVSSVPQTHRAALCPRHTKKGETKGIKSDKGQTSVSVSSRFYSTDWEESEGEARERERGSEWERKAKAGKQREREREKRRRRSGHRCKHTPLHCNTVPWNSARFAQVSKFNPWSITSLTPESHNRFIAVSLLRLWTCTESLNLTPHVQVKAATSELFRAHLLIRGFPPQFS